MKLKLNFPHPLLPLLPLFLVVALKGCKIIPKNLHIWNMQIGLYLDLIKTWMFCRDQRFCSAACFYQISMSVSIFPAAIFHPSLCAALKLFCNTQVCPIIFIIMKWDKTLLRCNQSHSWKQEVVHLFSVTKKGCDTRLHRQIWPLSEGDQRVEVNNSFPLMGCLKLLQVSVSV